MAENGHVGKDGLLEKFKELGIEVTTLEHPQVFTVEAMMPYVQHLPGVQAKNLFLKDKKKGLWLLSARHDANVKLAEISKKVGAPGGLRFADESVLFEKLGVKQGCVTAYSLINDSSKSVKFICDDALVNDKYENVYFHPLVNTATTGMSPANFSKFLEAIDHVPIKISLDTITDT